jgi:phage baseplate assembly protein W
VASPTIPHLDWPVQFTQAGHLKANEQDGIDDIATCVAISLLTPQGWRDEEPTFGSRPDFPLLPINLANLQNAIVRDEPRAQIGLHDDEATRQDLELRITTRITLAAGGSAS